MDGREQSGTIGCELLSVRLVGLREDGARTRCREKRCNVYALILPTYG
jgi:hypothetical protein